MTSAAIPDSPTAPRREIGWRRRWLLRAIVIASASSALCGVVGLQLLNDAASGMTPFGRWSLGAMFLFFALLLGAAGLTYLIASFRKDMVITIGPEGVVDTRLSPELIGWSQIPAITPIHYNGQNILVLNVERASRFPLARHPLWAINRLSSRLLGRPELALRLTGLDTDLQAVIDMIQSAAPKPPAPDHAQLQFDA